MIKSLVIFPTYNEKSNILQIINDVLTHGFEVLVIDDNSPDKTYEIVEKFFKSNKNVHLIKREEKLGLGSAYREGFSWGLKRNYDYLIEMDADFSHRVEDLNKLIQFKDQNKLILGSRYVSDGDIVGWSFRRKLLSKYANKLAKLITSSNVNDMTSGFRIYPKKILEIINFQFTQNDGYAFQIEMTLLVTKNKFEILEVPIIFEERRSGKSKLDNQIIREALKYLLFFRFQKK
ncbi:polyprenol monophosphomannose synthase [Acidimicrobiaceae bacterium]|nr:polyprenol monophosphomannose synthase [Acidimicrobiaceae bacterium]